MDAATSETLEARTENSQLVVFTLVSESFGIDIFRVHEIIRIREITPIPRTAPHVRGLLNLRGRTVPVVDLHCRFGLAPTEETDATRIIVVETDAGNVGMVVDAVAEVMQASGDQVEPPPSLVSDDATEFVRGVLKVDGRLITLLDLNEVLMVAA